MTALCPCSPQGSLVFPKSLNIRTMSLKASVVRVRSGSHRGIELVHSEEQKSKFQQLDFFCKVFARSREVSRQVDTAFADIWDINCKNLYVIRQGELEKKKKKRCTFIKR